jgi:hypothetical protein
MCRFKGKNHTPSVQGSQLEKKTIPIVFGPSCGFVQRVFFAVLLSYEPDLDYQLALTKKTLFISVNF